MSAVLWALGILVLLLAVLSRVGVNLPGRFREYVRHPGRLPVRNNARFFRERDDDPRYIKREKDGKP